MSDLGQPIMISTTTIEEVIIGKINGPVHYQKRDKFPKPTNYNKKFENSCGISQLHWPTKYKVPTK